MADTTEKEKREARSAGFTDGDYIPRNEAPNMPRVFSNGDMAAEREAGRRMMPVSLSALLCLLCLFLGLWLGSQSRESGALSPADASPVPGEPTANTLLPVRSNTQGAEIAEGDGNTCLGISVQTVSTAAAKYYRLYYDGCAVQGAQIYALGEDSPALQAGLRAGDILIALDGQAVRSAAELRTAEDRYRAGEQALCTVYRDGETVELPVVFRERQPESGEDGLDW